MSSEFNLKITQLNALMDSKSLDAIVLQRISSFAWATGGAHGYVGIATTNGPVQLVIKRNGERYFVTNNIEAPRLIDEDKMLERGWQPMQTHWHDGGKGTADLVHGLRVGSDGSWAGASDISADIGLLRMLLTPPEVARFRELGQLCARAIRDAAFAVRPGQSEMHIAGLLAYECQRRGVQAFVNLIATDERIFKYRHPLPTDKSLERYAMLVLTGRKWGLCCSVSRLIHFGPVPTDIQRRIEAVAHVDAALIGSSVAGNTLAQALQNGINAYAKCGFADEWRYHHQGGLTGYEAREMQAKLTSTLPLAANYVAAWNPSISGAKAEDTVLLTDTTPQVLTLTPEWPVIQAEFNGQIWERPGILVQN